MDLREQFIQSELGRCKHFTGTQHETCRAGVNYRALAGEPELGWGLRLPCGLRLPAGSKEVTPAICDKREVYTAEEAATRADEHIAAHERFCRAHGAAHDDAKARGFKRGHGGQGEVACPICAGTIIYTVASYNGHMWGKCTTPKCVSWME